MKALLTLSLGILIGQTLLYPTGNGPYLKQAAPVPPGFSVWATINGTPTRLYSVTATFVSVRDQAVYDKALADCKAAPPPVGGAGGFAPDCALIAEQATKADSDRRVAIGEAAIPPNVLLANKLYVVQP